MGIAEPTIDPVVVWNASVVVVEVAELLEGNPLTIDVEAGKTRQGDSGDDVCGFGGVGKVIARILAPATDQSIERALSMSTFAGTSKLVNHAHDLQRM